jgi:hypothetical protein
MQPEHNVKAATQAMIARFIVNHPEAHPHPA